MKNSNDTIGNQTRDFPSFSAVPRPTASPRTRIRPLAGYKFQTNAAETTASHKESFEK